MSDWVFIKYNGVDAFAPQPTPVIALEEQGIYVNELWGRSEVLTLEGQLTGCTYQEITQAQANLLNNFSKPYQMLEVYQQTGNLSWQVFQKELVQIDSIVFQDSRWRGVLPYTIRLSCYPSGLFSGAYGILNPSDTWNFNENDNASLDATHTLSCQPFNTSSGPSNALDNARNWAFGRTGTQDMIAPILISGVNPNYFCLLTQEETIDRFNGTYSLTENYTNDLARSGYGVIRYTTDISSGNNLISVELKGVAQGCNRNINELRQAVAQIDKTALAQNAYKSAFDRSDLNPIPLTQSIAENPFTTTIEFSYTYDNNNKPETWFDYSVSCSIGTNGFISSNIDGTIYARGGDTLSKLQRAQAYASGINLYDLCLPFYNNFDISATGAPLNPIPVSATQTNNQTDGTVVLSASYNNRLQGSSVLNQFEATLSVQPAKTQYDPAPKLNGMGIYSIVDLGYKTLTSASIGGTAVINRDADVQVGIDAIKSTAYSLFQKYITDGGILTKSVITTSRTDERVVSFDFQWVSQGNGGINT